MANIRPLNADLQKVAIEQLNEVPERIPADLEALRTWIKQQPHLTARTDDQFLLSFLRGCKYSLEKAKSKIDKYYTMRTKFPELLMCHDVDSRNLREILRTGVCFDLPIPLHDNGPRIIIMRNGAIPAAKYPIEDIVHYVNAIQEICIFEDDYANVNGIVFIMDMDKATAAHLFQMTPSLMKKMTVYSEEAIPLRPKAQHFLNTIAGFETVFNMVKPMMSEKQQKRLFVHGNKLDKLHAQIPKKYLPKEYGGENGTIEDICAELEKRLDAYREHFKDNVNYGTDEKLRPGKPIDFENLFGIEGSFRKLNVD